MDVSKTQICLFLRYIEFTVSLNNLFGQCIETYLIEGNDIDLSEYPVEI